MVTRHGGGDVVDFMMITAADIGAVVVVTVVEAVIEAVVETITMRDIGTRGTACKQTTAEAGPETAMMTGITTTTTIQGRLRDMMIGDITITIDLMTAEICRQGETSLKIHGR